MGCHSASSATISRGGCTKRLPGPQDPRAVRRGGAAGRRAVSTSQSSRSPPGPTGSSTSGTRGVVAGLIAAQRLPAIGLQLLAQVGRDDVQLRVDRIEASRARPWEIMAVGRWRSEAAAMRYLGRAPRPPARNDVVRERSIALSTRSRLVIATAVASGAHSAATPRCPNSAAMDS